MVRALDWGSRSREFESHHSDEKRTRTLEAPGFFFLLNDIRCQFPDTLSKTSVISFSGAGVIRDTITIAAAESRNAGRSS